MGGIAGITLGAVIAVLGFLVLRNPGRLARVNPNLIAYYQKLQNDRSQRMQARGFGAIVSLLGLVIASAAMKGVLQVRVLGTVSDALLLLMSLLFVGAWTFGLFSLIVLIIRGRARELFVEWFRLLKQRPEPGATSAFLPVTPEIKREAQLFTVAFLLLVSVAIIASLCRDLLPRP